jgi:TolB protein
VTRVQSPRGVAAIALLLAFATSMGAQDTVSRGVRIGLRYDPGSKPGVIVLPVSGTSGDSIRVILERDFDYSDRLNPISLSPEDGSILASPPSGGGAPALNYPVFAKVGAAGVIQITITTRGLHVALHDVARAAVAQVREFPVPRDAFTREWRQAVHGMADVIQEWITGERGASQTRLAFIRNNAVFVVDADGFGETPVPMIGPALSPSWHPQGTMIAYNTFGPESRIAVHDLRSGKTREFGSQRNTSNLTPIFSPDGKSILYALSTEAGTDLFFYPLDGEAFPRRVTVGRGSRNWGPTFQPDGRRIAFSSDRTGTPQVYIIDSDGTNLDWFTRFDFGDQNDRGSPDWSPDGRQIAFQSRIDGRYQIFTMSLRDQQPRQLTSEGENEDPSWAPDGRHLVFASKRTGTWQLWVLDVESARLRQLTQVGGSRVPAWSPRLTNR